MRGRTATAALVAAGLTMGGLTVGGLGVAGLGAALAGAAGVGTAAAPPGSDGADGDKGVLAGVRVFAQILAALDRAAMGGAPAGRDVAVDPIGQCDLAVVAGLAARHPEVGQFVVVRTAGWAEVAAVVDVVVRDGDGAWRCQRGSQGAMVGRSGVRPLLDRRSGDGTTPAGVFPLGVATAWDGQRFSFFGNRPDPGVRGTYRQVRPEDCWGATPGDAAYNHLVRRPGCPGPADEWLPRFGDVYAHAALIGANTEPAVSGDAPGEPAFAAAIFLHRHAYRDGDRRPTSGCVSLALADLVATLGVLDPSRAVHFAIGPGDWLRETA